MNEQIWQKRTRLMIGWREQAEHQGSFKRTVSVASVQGVLQLCPTTRVGYATEIPERTLEDSVVKLSPILPISVSLVDLLLHLIPILRSGVISGMNQNLNLTSLWRTAGELRSEELPLSVCY
jgi:hypothetical protein